MQQPTEGARSALLLNAPNGEPQPLAYRWLRAHGLAALRPWYFIDDPGEALLGDARAWANAEGLARLLAAQK